MKGFGYPLYHSELDLLGWGSFIVGFTHPVLGLDHLLAMISVGIVSAQLGGNAIWTVPATFVGVMAVGGLLGFLALPMPPVELGIAFSVLFLGVVIMLNWSLPLSATTVAVGIFAIFHGYAHGIEIPVTAVPIRYAAGFLTSTAGIHLAGVLIGQVPSRSEYSNITYGFIGSTIAVCGIYFLLR